MARCITSKQPFVKTTQPFSFHISRPELPGEVPNLETAIEAHWLENLAASILLAPQKEHTQGMLMCVSRPDTSNTLQQLASNAFLCF